jgi:hypothetical protein
MVTANKARYRWASFKQIAPPKACHAPRACTVKRCQGKASSPNTVRRTVSGDIVQLEIQHDKGRFMQAF